MPRHAEQGQIAGEFQWRIPRELMRGNGSTFRAYCEPTGEFQWRIPRGLMDGYTRCCYGTGLSSMAGSWKGEATAPPELGLSVRGPVLESVFSSERTFRIVFKNSSTSTECGEG